MLLRLFPNTWSVSADNLAWDPDQMGGSMMVPVVYVTWFMFVTFASLLGKLPQFTPAGYRSSCGHKAVP